MNAFSLLIKPVSADCNLHCAYCFYRDRASLYPETPVHRMSEAVLKRLIASYMATDQPQYAFGWQGGEPTLLGVEFFQRVTTWQMAYGQRGAVVTNGLQTNATRISNELASHFARYRFLAGVSLDGPASVHDQYRRTAGNGGSHDAVLRGIACLKRHNVDFNILTLVSRANVHQPRALYHYLCDQGFFYHQYIPCVEYDASGNALQYTIDTDAWGEFLCRLYDEWSRSDTQRVSIRLFDAILRRLLNGETTICHMGTNCCQYFLVEYNGDIYPCDFFVEKNLILGNLMNTSWEQVQASPLYRQFGRQKREWNTTCNTCEWIALCAGDCLKHRYARGYPSRQLSRLCRGWKTFFAHSISGFRRLAERIRAERRQVIQFEEEPQAGKPGRNDFCPCGSGLKYKKCCMGIRNAGHGSSSVGSAVGTISPPH